MRAKAHISVQKTQVGTGALSRHVAVELEAGKAFAIATGLGAPRTWGLATDAVLGGFAEGLAGSTTRGADRLDDAFFAAQERLAARCDALIERVLPDASLIAALLDQGQLSVIVAGPGRAYIKRTGTPERITPRDDDDTGVLGGAAKRRSAALQPNDVIILGSATAFTRKAIEKLTEVLGADRDAPPPVLAPLLTEPAGQAGVGAAAIVMRVR